MARLLLQFVLIVASFFALWLALSKVDWMTKLEVKEKSKGVEEKIGEIYWDFFKTIEDEITDEKVLAPLDSLLSKLCTSNDIDRKKIKLHLIDKDEVNAFALPDHHLVVFSGLILDSENEAELCGVLAHELAHLEKGHIMKKLTREVGLSLLITMTSGNGSPEIVKQVAKALTSTAYERDLEREADLTGVDYLIRAGINPEGLASFLFRMSAHEKDLPDQLFWISTHPGGEDRTVAIMEYLKVKEYETSSILTSEIWNELQAHLQKQE